MGEEERPTDYYGELIRSLGAEIGVATTAIKVHVEHSKPYHEDTKDHARLLYGIDGRNGLVGRVNKLDDDVADMKARTIQSWRLITLQVAAAAGVISLILEVWGFFR